MYKQYATADDIIAASKGTGILVLKHSTACPISGRAKLAMDGFLQDNTNAGVYLVVVQERRDISSEIEAKLGIRHETPQLLLIEDGRVAGSWSHYQITREQIASALA